MGPGRCSGLPTKDPRVRGALEKAGRSTAGQAPSCPAPVRLSPPLPADRDYATPGRERSTVQWLTSLTARRGPRQADLGIQRWLEELSPPSIVRDPGRLYGQVIQRRPDHWLEDRQAQVSAGRRAHACSEAPGASAARPPRGPPQRSRSANKGSSCDGLSGRIVVGWKEMRVGWTLGRASPTRSSDATQVEHDTTASKVSRARWSRQPAESCRAPQQAPTWASGRRPTWADASPRSSSRSQRDGRPWPRGSACSPRDPSHSRAARLASAKRRTPR